MTKKKKNVIKKLKLDMGRVEKGEKEKMLVTSIFSFSHNIFKRHLPQGLEKSGLCGKELRKETCLIVTINVSPLAIQYLIVTNQMKNIAEKEVSFGNLHFTPFPTLFSALLPSLYPCLICCFETHSIWPSQMYWDKVIFLLMT